jgi:hypothetical protein
MLADCYVQVSNLTLAMLPLVLAQAGFTITRYGAELPVRNLRIVRQVLGSSGTRTCSASLRLFRPIGQSAPRTTTLSMSMLQSQELLTEGSPFSFAEFKRGCRVPLLFPLNCFDVHCSFVAPAVSLCPMCSVRANGGRLSAGDVRGLSAGGAGAA